MGVGLSLRVDFLLPDIVGGPHSHGGQCPLLGKSITSTVPSTGQNIESYRRVALQFSDPLYRMEWFLVS